MEERARVPHPYGQVSERPLNEFGSLSDVFGLTALVEILNNPRVGTRRRAASWARFSAKMRPIVRSRFISSAMSRVVLAHTPFLAVSRLQTVLVSLGESIASEGKGEYMYVEGRVLTTGGEPIPGAVIDTWETDSTGERHFEMHVPSGLTMDVWVRRVAFQPPHWHIRPIRFGVCGTHCARVPWPAEDGRGGQVRISRGRPRSILRPS